MTSKIRQNAPRPKCTIFSWCAFTLPTLAVCRKRDKSYLGKLVVDLRLPCLLQRRDFVDFCVITRINRGECAALSVALYA